jgi:DNA-binding NarL/FixJ family response regulator
MKTVRVLIADDHELVREGLRTLLAEASDMEVVGEAKNGAEAVQLTGVLQPDVVLMDLQMPIMDGIEATGKLRATSPSVHVVVLTTFVDAEKVKSAIQAGALGYLLKDVKKDDLLQAVRDAAMGTPTLHAEAQKSLMAQVTHPGDSNPIATLTHRERDVLALIAQGQSNKEIGNTLSLTEGTVKGYVSAILSKIGVQDRTQAALFAVKHDIR